MRWTSPLRQVSVISAMLLAHRPMAWMVAAANSLSVLVTYVYHKTEKFSLQYIHVHKKFTYFTFHWIMIIQWVELDLFEDFQAHNEFTDSEVSRVLGNFLFVINSCKIWWSLMYSKFSLFFFFLLWSVRIKKFPSFITYFLRSKYPVNKKNSIDTLFLNIYLNIHVNPAIYFIF